MTNEMKLVGYNVDTLYTNVRRKNHDGKLSHEGIDERLAHDLDDLQAIAKEQEAEVATPWSFGGVPLMMQTHGVGKRQ
jgi:hypothetical protein